MTRTERIKLLAQSIGADIKAILAKTNLLKTAAYKDVGTTAGMIPEFVGNEGIGGFGYGGSAKKLAVGADLDLLPRVNALYTGAKADGILNRPPDLVKYIFNHEFVLECIVGDGLSTSYGTYIQRLSLDAFPPGTTDKTNPVVFVRSISYKGFSTWVRITGVMYGVDVGGDVIGDDLVVNSIKAGATSPKIAFETVKIGITYDNFKYMPDGVSIAGPYDARGAVGLRPSCAETSILSMTMRIYAPIYASYGDNTLRFASAKSRYTGTYYDTAFTGDHVTLMIKTKAHITEVGNIGNPAEVSGDNLFGEGAYAELFVIYKVD